MCLVLILGMQTRHKLENQSVLGGATTDHQCILVQSQLRCKGMAASCRESLLLEKLMHLTKEMAS